MDRTKQRFRRQQGLCLPALAAANRRGRGRHQLDGRTNARQALLNLAFRLTRRQERDDYLRINPKARKGLAEWELKEFMEGLSEGEEV